MKRTVGLIAVLFLSMQVFTQVTITAYEGVKDYDNGHRIAYFYIQNLKNDKDFVSYLQAELKNDKDFSRFIIYPQNEKGNRVMMEANYPVTNSQLSSIINTFYKRYYQLKSKYPNDKQSFYLELYNVQDFPVYIDTGNEKQDEENYENRKQEWIKNNPERFKKIKHLSLDIFSK